MTDYWILDLFFLLPSRYVSWNNTKAELILALLCPHKTFWSYSFTTNSYRDILVTHDGSVLTTFILDMDSVAGPTVSQLGGTKIPQGQHPVLLFNCELSLQTQSGKMVKLVLSTYDIPNNVGDFKPDEMKEWLRKNLALGRCLIYISTVLGGGIQDSLSTYHGSQFLWKNINRHSNTRSSFIISTALLNSKTRNICYYTTLLYFIIQKYQQGLVFDNLPSGPSPAASLLLLVPALTGQLTGHVLPHPAQSLLQLLWYLRLHPGNVPITTLLSVISLFIYLTSLKNCFLAATNIPSSESRTNWTIL